MPKIRYLSQPQQTVLIRAGKSDKAMADHVPVAAGMALEEKGYGTYNLTDRIFYLNNAGLRFALHGELLAW